MFIHVNVWQIFSFLSFFFFFFFFLILVTNTQLWDFLSHHQCSLCNLIREIIQKQPCAGGAIFAYGGRHQSGERCLCFVFFLNPLWLHTIVSPIVPQYGLTNLCFHKHSSEACLSQGSQKELYFVLAPTSSKDRLIFYQQLIAITAALWPDKDLLLYGSVIISCSLVGLSDHLPFPLFTEVLAQMNFPGCNWVRQLLNHVS